VPPFATVIASALSHGENRGSSPLGSANDFNNLTPLKSCRGRPSPTFLQWTVLPEISSSPPCDRRKEAGSDWRSHRRAGIGACFLKMTHTRIAALPAEQIEHAPHRFSPELRRAIRQHVLRPAALFTRSAFLIFGPGELTPTARASKLPATDNQFSSLRPPITCPK
jgi:hypothetical protein